MSRAFCNEDDDTYPLEVRLFEDYDYPTFNEEFGFTLVVSDKEDLETIGERKIKVDIN